MPKLKVWVEARSSKYETEIDPEDLEGLNLKDTLWDWACEIAGERMLYDIRWHYVDDDGRILESDS